MSAESVESLPQRHLAPGRMLVSHRPALIATVLGSCLSVTMHDRITGLAAICHATLPRPRNLAVSELFSSDHVQFVEHVIPQMHQAFQRAGICRSRIEVKMFGGGNVLSIRNRGAGSPFEIGEANVEAARRCLEAEGLHIAAENVGGNSGRKILFNTFTGEVLHKLLTRWPQSPR